MFASMFEQPLVIGALVACPVIYFGGLALGRWLKRQHRVPLGILYHLLCVALGLYVPLVVIHAVNPAAIPAGAAESWQDRCLRYFSSALILLGIVFALALLRRFYWQRWFKRTHETEAPKLLQQVFSFTAFAIALMLVLNLRHGQQVDTFLAGSGIVAVVLGFAMQETLANIISGIALQISKPFKVGDWLIVEKHRAEVIEMNWRSTRLRTNDDVYLDIPNKSVTSAMITNLSYPTKNHAYRIRVRFELRVPPNKVREILRRAAQSANGVLAHPPVKVFLVEFADLAAVYEIKYYLEEAARFNDIEDGIRTNIWYEAERSKLVIPPPSQTFVMRRDGESISTRTPAADLLRSQPFFKPLTEAQREALVAGAKILRFGRGEKIIRQGDEGCSMFVILEGNAEVIVDARGQALHVADLHAGEAFGEMCMLTGENRSASVMARTDCQIWEIERAVMAPLLQENEELAKELSELLAHRKLETEGLIAAQMPPQVVEDKRREYARGFFKRISALFEI
jgi:small-conductance mechanosensitive channel/CRP-like cAMP-binding protein